MPKRTYKRLVLGDIIEIPLPRKRFGYAQYIYFYSKPPGWGTLIRVIKGIHKNRSSDLEALASGEDLFCTFYPAGTCLNQGLIRIVGNAQIPKRYAKLKQFVSCSMNLATRENLWSLSDGSKAWRISKLEPKHYNLPFEELISHPILVERILTGWTLRDEV